MKNLLRSASRRLWKEWIKPLLIVAAIVFPAKSSFADWNWVPSGSMRPTILEGELVFINKLAYDLKLPFTTRHIVEWGDPQRGEIVVFFSPLDRTRLVKRVIGLPGDRIALRANRLTINGQPVAWNKAGSSWLQHATVLEKQAATVSTERLGGIAHPMMQLAGQPGRRDFDEIVVPAGQYFMMGDNRDISFDSRYFGFVSREQIVGRANFVVLSFDTERHLKPRLDRWFSGLL